MMASDKNILYDRVFRHVERNSGNFIHKCPYPPGYFVMSNFSCSVKNIELPTGDVIVKVGIKPENDPGGELKVSVFFTVKRRLCKTCNM